MLSRPTTVSKGAFFLPGQGIAREVISADIQRYLGPDALISPGASEDGVVGYWITAYRPLTSQMVQDLKLDSTRWGLETTRQRKPKNNSRSSQY